MAHDVFISHSAKDKVTGDAVCAMLEANGVRCWIAPRDVTPGMEWGECIIDAIEECRIMVLVFSAHANESPQIRKEIERAVNHGVAILPVRIEDVLPGKALEYFIGNVHWLDALTLPLENHLQNLAGTVKMLLGRMEPREAAPIAAASSPSNVTETPKVFESTPVPPEKPSAIEGLPKREAATEAAFENVTGRAFGDLKSPRTVPSEARVEETKKPETRRRWLRFIIAGALLVVVALVVILFFIPSGPRRGPVDTSRLAFALVATNPAQQSGAPLHDYSDASKTYSIERDITVPGDIESAAAVKDVMGNPAIEIRLTDAAVKRMNSGANIVGRDMALVLDDRTVLSVARVQSGLGNVIIMTGNFSPGDIQRMLDAISAGAPGNH
jgi:hypothetical protein